MEVKYIKPLINIKAMEQFGEDNSARFSDEFVSFFKENNGGRPSNNLCVLKNGNEKVVNSFLSFNEEDKDNVYKAKRRTEEDDGKLIPFANDPAGNYFCLKDNSVIFYSSDDGMELEISDSFIEFINNLQ